MNKKLPLRKSTIAAVSIVALAAQVLSAQASPAPVVLNGSFEDAVSPFTFPYVFGTPNFEIPTGPQNYLKNWTTAGPPNSSGFLDCLVFPNTATINVCGGGFKLWKDPGESPDKGNVIAFDGDPSIAHSIFQDIKDLIPGQFYNVSFWQAAGQLTDRTGDTTERWDVSLGAEHHNSDEMFNKSMSFVGWNFQTLTFQAQNATDVLRFYAVGTPSGLPPFVLLDGVSITAVPEPASCALLGIGVLGFLLVRGRRRSPL